MISEGKIALRVEPMISEGKIALRVEPMISERNSCLTSRTYDI